MFERFSLVDGKMVSDPNGDYIFYRVYEMLVELGTSHNSESAPCPGCGELVVVELCPSCKVMADNSNFM